MIHLIGYDLHNPGRDYAKVSETIKTADSWAHPQGSVWLIDTMLEPASWRDRLKVVGDANDEYFVVRLHHNWASYGTDKVVTDWLNAPSRRW